MTEPLRVRVDSSSSRARGFLLRVTPGMPTGQTRKYELVNFGHVNWSNSNVPTGQTRTSLSRLAVYRLFRHRRRALSNFTACNHRKEEGERERERRERERERAALGRWSQRPPRNTVPRAPARKRDSERAMTRRGTLRVRVIISLPPSPVPAPAVTATGEAWQTRSARDRSRCGVFRDW